MIPARVKSCAPDRVRSFPEQCRRARTGRSEPFDQTRDQWLNESRTKVFSASRLLLFELLSTRSDTLTLVQFSALTWLAAVVTTPTRALATPRRLVPPNWPWRASPLWLPNWQLLERLPSLVFCSTIVAWWSFLP